MAFHPLMKLIAEGLDDWLQDTDKFAFEKLTLKDIFDKNQLREFIKASPVDEDLYYALINDKKEFLFETGGNYIKKLLHKKENGIQNQRETVRFLAEGNREDDVTEGQSKNYLHYISVAITYQNTFLGSFIIGGFFIGDDHSKEERHKEWCRNNGFDYSASVHILQQVPSFDISYVGKLKQYFLSLVQLITRNVNDQAPGNNKSYEKDNQNMVDVVNNYQDILNSSSDAILITDNDLNLIFTNQSCSYLIKKSLDKEDHPSLSTLFNERSYQTLYEKFDRQRALLKQDKKTSAFNLNVEFNHPGKNTPEKLMLQAQLIKDHSGNPKGLFGVLKSHLTDTDKIIESLTAERDFYRNLFYFAPLGMFYYDNHEIILDCNKKFCEILGAKKDTMVGMPVSCLENPEMINQIRKSLSGQRGYYQGTYKKVKENREVYIKGHFEGVVKTNKVLYGIGIIEDITSRT